MSSNNQVFHRLSNYDVNHMIKYSGALEEYPWLERVIQNDATNDLENEINYLNDELESIKTDLEDAEELLYEIFSLLKNDNVQKFSYKCLKEQILKLRGESNWEG